MMLHVGQSQRARVSVPSPGVSLRPRRRLMYFSLLLICVTSMSRQVYRRRSPLRLGE